MTVGLYLDHNVNRAITQGLRLREVDVLTAYEDASHLLPDPELLDRATIFAPQSCVVSVCIDQLEVLAKAGVAEDFKDTLLFLPLR